MNNPLDVEGTRVCVLVHRDEVVVCANLAGFQALCTWMAWLAESNPEESFHFHVLWHLESEASRFENVRPANVWVLQTPPDHQVKTAPPEGTEATPFELTFQVVTESSLDELAAAQESGFIPTRYLKLESSYVGDCG